MYFLEDSMIGLILSERTTTKMLLILNYNKKKKLNKSVLYARVCCMYRNHTLNMEVSDAIL